MSRREGTSTADSDVRWQRAGLLSLVALAAVMLATFRDYGPIWDANSQRIYGDSVLSWYASRFADRSALDESLRLHLYGGFFDATAQLASRLLPLDVFEARHLVNAAFSLLGVAATWRMGTLLGGPRAGLTAAVFLVLTPSFYGHAFVNPKDAPFAALFAWSLLQILRVHRRLPKVSWPLVLGTGIAIGLAMGVRVGGIMLLGFAAILWAAGLAGRESESGDGARSVGTVGRLALTPVVAWLAMLVFWPWAQLDPVSRPFEALRQASHFAWDHTMLFNGREVLASSIPWTYLPVRLGVALPEFYGVALLAAVLLGASAAFGGTRPAIDRARVLEIIWLGSVVVLPIAAAVAVGATLYDGHRHFLFVLPPLAVLAGLAFDAAVRSPRLGRGTRALLGMGALVSGALTVLDMVELHPYQYVFFNRLVAGGLKAASARFETDYWGSSYREGTAWVLAHYPARPGDRVTVSNCSSTFLTAHWIESDPGAGDRFLAVKPKQDPDVFLATTRWGCHNAPGRRIHTVSRQGTPLLYVIERRPLRTSSPGVEAPTTRPGAALP